MKRELLQIAAIVLAGILGIGGYYAYVMIEGHKALDKALIEVIQASQKPAD